MILLRSPGFKPTARTSFFLSTSCITFCLNWLWFAPFGQSEPPKNTGQVWSLKIPVSMYQYKIQSRIEKNKKPGLERNRGETTKDFHSMLNSEKELDILFSLRWFWKRYTVIIGSRRADVFHYTQVLVKGH